MLYQGIPCPTLSSFFGYFSCSWATCAEVRPLSMSVERAWAVSSTERRNGCFGNSAIVARRQVTEESVLGCGPQVRQGPELIHRQWVRRLMARERLDEEGGRGCETASLGAQLREATRTLTGWKTETTSFVSSTLRESLVCFLLEISESGRRDCGSGGGALESTFAMVISSIKVRRGQMRAWAGINIRRRLSKLFAEPF